VTVEIGVVSLIDTVAQISQIPQQLCIAFFALEMDLPDDVAFEDDGHGLLHLRRRSDDVDGNDCDPAGDRLHDLVAEDQVLLALGIKCIGVEKAVAQHSHDLLGVSLRTLHPYLNVDFRKARCYHSDFGGLLDFGNKLVVK